MTPEILFVCVHNAGRSQMAALLTSHLAGEHVRVRSAGSDPADHLNPLAVAAMAELGLDLSHTLPTALTDEHLSGADVVITMGCGEACPASPGARYEDWQVDDPAAAGDLAEVRAIREAIRRRVLDLLDSLGIEVRPAAR